MSFKTIRNLAALGMASAMAVGCAVGPDHSSHQGPNASNVITGTAAYRERMALPDNAIFEAVLEDVSRADARAVVVGQQTIGPAGNPPYAIRIPFDVHKLDPRGRYNVRTSIRVNDQLWFMQDQAAPVLQHPGDTQVNVVMQRVAQSQPPQTGAVQPTQPDMPPGALVAPALRHAWRVTHLDGKALPSAGAARAPSISFDGKQARVSGDSSCNRFSASYRVQGERLSFSPATATKMACAASVEREFFRSLEAVRSHRSSGRQLQLLDANGRTLMTLTRI